MTGSVRKRKKLTAEKKYAIVEEVKRNSSTKSEILRREGLYSTDLQRYEEIARNGALRALRESRLGRKISMLKRQPQKPTNP